MQKSIRQRTKKVISTGNVLLDDISRRMTSTLSSTIPAPRPVRAIYASTVSVRFSILVSSF